MLRRRFSVGAAFILVVASIHAGLRAQSTPGEAGQGQKAATLNADAENAEEVVKLEGQNATLCGRLIRENPIAGQKALSPFPDVILARGQRFRLDPTHYKGLEAYLGKLPAELKPLVHVEGKHGAPGPADGAPVIAVMLFQPLDHWKDMGVDASNADKARAAAIAKVGGLVMTMPHNYPLFDAFRAAVARAGLEVIDRGKDDKDLGGRQTGYFFAMVRPGGTFDPRFIAAMTLDRHVRIYPFRNVKDISSAPPPTASATVRSIAKARGLVVVLSPGDELTYDAIVTGLGMAGFVVDPNPVQREAGHINASMAVQSPDLKYIETLVRDPLLKVFPFKNHEGHIPAGEQGGPGQPSRSTPLRRD
jgi:hypothetical protein